MGKLIKAHLAAAAFVVAVGVVGANCLNAPENELIKPLEQTPKGPPLVYKKT